MARSDQDACLPKQANGQESQSFCVLVVDTDSLMIRFFGVLAVVLHFDLW